jgi:hypothetical protein
MRLNVLKNALHFFRVFNQCLDGGGEHSFEALELAIGSARSWLFVYSGSGWVDRFKVEC